MRDAVIVSTARTPIGKAFRGALNSTSAAEIGGHALAEAVKRAGLEPGRVEDVIIGCSSPEGTAAGNIGRQVALRSGMPTTVAGATVSRMCASGLLAISSAADRIRTGEAEIIAAGGLESISLVQNEHRNRYRWQDEWLLRHRPDIYMPMIDTADIVAKRYGITREAQDEYSVESQRRTAAAKEAGRFDAEIAPITVTRDVVDKAGQVTGQEKLLFAADEGNRPGTELSSLAALKPVKGEGNFITAGNASQLSDGASACVLMSEAAAARTRCEPLAIYRGAQTVGCDPDEMGIGPVFAVPKLLKHHGLSVDDIGLWELNEAFAVQVIYCRDRLGIPSERLNVDGGAISIGHPYGMTGARLTGHAVVEGKRRGIKYAVVTMCIGGGQGAAALFEIV